MKINRKMKSGYSTEIAKQYVTEGKPIYFVSSFEEIQHKYVDGERTNEIAAYKYYFVQEGLNPFAIKFENEIIDMPSFLSKVSVIDLEAVEVRSNVYFKAKSIEVIK